MKRLRRKKRLVKAILLQLFLFSAILISFQYLYAMIHPSKAEIDNPSVSVTPTVREEIPVSTNSDALLIKSNQLFSRNAILVRLSDKKVLYDKERDEIIYPASLTKIMTAVIAIENIPNLDAMITLPSDIFQNLYEEDASMAGFLPGESVSALDLLYGVLLPSGAECCIGLCDYIGGSETAFVDLMNAKAKELGMKNTHFTNSTGLNDPDHYTTVSDLAILLEYALQNDTFRKIFTSSRHSLTASLHPDGITFYSTMFKNLTSPEFNGGSILGGKTGYTKEAGLCLASLAEKNGCEYILVTAGAKGDHDTEQYNIEDALFTYNNIK